jgi:hypothetical protein
MFMIEPGRPGTATKFSQEAWKLSRSPKAMVAARRSQEQVADHVDPRRARMLCMTQDQEISPPSDVCLLLRADAEQRWLSLEVGPVLRQLQQRDGLPEEQLGAALAYLEVLWIEASQRAAETDAAYAQLEVCEQPDATPDAGGWTLPSKARRFHAAVQTLREVLGRQVAILIAAPGNGSTREHVRS